MALSGCRMIENTLSIKSAFSVWSQVFTSCTPRKRNPCHEKFKKCRDECLNCNGKCALFPYLIFLMKKQSRIEKVASTNFRQLFIFLHKKCFS